MANNNPNMYHQDLPPYPNCSRHHEPIKGVCLFPGTCNDRLICRTCRKFHDRNHLNFYEGLEDIFNGSLIRETMNDFEGIVGKIDAHNLSASKTSQFLIGQIDTQFNDVKDYILQKLEQVRTVIFEDIQQKFKNNTGAKAQIIQQMGDIQKHYEIASKNGFQTQHLILNVINTLTSAQSLKDRVVRDPEFAAQQSGELTRNYMALVTRGELLTTVKMSFDRICEDMTESFTQRGRETGGLAGLSGGNEMFGGFQNDIKRSMGRIGGDFGGGSGGFGFSGGMFQNQNQNQNNQDFQTNLTNILNNAAANSRRSLSKGFPGGTSFGGFNRGGLNQGGGQGLFSGGGAGSAYDSQENSRGFENEFTNRRFGNQQGNNGNGNYFFNKKTPSSLPQKILQPETSDIQKNQVPDFTTLVKGISASDLMQAQSELKLKAPQNSFAFESTSMLLGSNKQSMNKQFGEAVLQLEEVVENEQQGEEQPYGFEGNQEGIELEEQGEGEQQQNANNMSIIEPEPYDPDAGQEENEGGQMLEEYQPQQESRMQMEAPREQEKPRTPNQPRTTPNRILEVFKQVQEESKSSARRVEGGGDPRKKSVSPIDDRSEQVKYLNHFYTQHKKIMGGAMAYIPTQKHLATGGVDGKIEIWDVDSMRNVKTWNAHKGEVFKLYFVEGHDVLVSGGADGKVNVWNCDQNYNSVKVYEKHKGPVYALEYLANMNMMASGGEDGLLRIWSLEGMKEDYAVNISGENISSLFYFGTAKRLVVGLNNGGLKVYNMESSVKKLVSRCQGHEGTGFVSSMGGSDEKKLLLTAGEDGFVKMWKLEGDNLIQQKVVVGQKGEAVRNFVFSFPKDLIVTNHADRKIRLWKGSSGAKIGEKYDKSFGESCVLFREVLKLITAHEGEVKLWQINL